MAAYVLLCFLFACSVHAHKCEHDKFMAENKMPRIVSHQTYLNHPFETSKTLEVHIHRCTNLSIGGCLYGVVPCASMPDVVPCIFLCVKGK